MCAGVLQRRGFREGLAQVGQESEEEGPLGRTRAGRRGGPGDKGGGLSRSEQKQPSQEEGLERSLWGEQGLEGGARLPPGGPLRGEGVEEGAAAERRTTQEWSTQEDSGGPLSGPPLHSEEAASPGRGCCWDEGRKGKPRGASVRENGVEGAGRR